MGSGKVGFEGVIGIKAGGISGSGNFLPVTLARDVEADASHAEADFTSRASQGFEQMEPTFKQLEVTLNVIYDPDDEAFAALKEAYDARSQIGVAMMDGDLDTGNGWMFNGKVFNWRWGQPLRDAMTIDVTIKPSYSPEEPPEWVEGGTDEYVGNDIEPVDPEPLP